MSETEKVTLTTDRFDSRAYNWPDGTLAVFDRKTGPGWFAIPQGEMLVTDEIYSTADEAASAVGARLP